MPGSLRFCKKNGPCQAEIILLGPLKNATSKAASAGKISSAPGSFQVKVFPYSAKMPERCRWEYEPFQLDLQSQRIRSAMRSSWLNFEATANGSVCQYRQEFVWRKDTMVSLIGNSIRSLIFVVVSGMIVGCGGGAGADRPDRTLVSGTITFAGAPVSDAIVVLRMSAE